MVVVGSGVAGLTCALHLREAGLHVTVVTKVNIDDGSTRWAQGGIAAVLDPLDTPAAHAADTLVAGVGLCDPAAVEVLVSEGPARVRELIRWGAEFDRHPDGSLMLTREGGHHANRIVHAGGDATGAEVQRALHAAVRRDPWIRLVEHALVLDLLRATPTAGPAGSPCTCSARAPRTASARSWPARWCSPPAAWARSSRPPPTRSSPPATGSRWRCGPARRSPTSSSSSSTRPRSSSRPAGRPAPAQQPLVSEALRGEGAHLVDGDGKRFMVGQHELAELAPRDVVAKGIHRVLLADRHRPRVPRRPAPARSWPAGSRPSPRPAGRPASTRRPT